MATVTFTSWGAFDAATLAISGAVRYYTVESSGLVDQVLAMLPNGSAHYYQCQAADKLQPTDLKLAGAVAVASLREI